jgi:hypothetical protein
LKQKTPNSPQKTEKTNNQKTIGHSSEKEKIRCVAIDSSGICDCRLFLFLHANPSPPTMERIGLETLVQRLTQLLNSEKVTIEVAQDPKVEAVMKSFDPTFDHDWESYYFQDPQVPYTRNLVAAGPDYDLILLVWNPKQRRYALVSRSRFFSRANSKKKKIAYILFYPLIFCSPIHDHPGSNCWMRIVQGTLTENRFAYGVDKIDVTPTMVTPLGPGFCAYVNGEGLSIFFPKIKKFGD